VVLAGGEKAIMAVFDRKFGVRGTSPRSIGQDAWAPVQNCFCPVAPRFQANRERSLPAVWYRAGFAIHRAFAALLRRVEKALRVAGPFDQENAFRWHFWRQFRRLWRFGSRLF
jgi:hypothetical protein